MLSVEKTLKQEIEQWKHEYEVLDACCELAQSKIEELKAENERLKEEIKEVKKYQYEQEYLDKEIEEMQKALKTLAEGLNKRQMLLQEIKNIAGKPKPFIDFSEIKTATEVEYDYAAICNEFELRLHKVLELITKAESEG